MAETLVDDFRRSLDARTLATVDLLRSVIIGAQEGLVERIKWNGPSFALGGEDRITLGRDRKGGVRLVLHRGAKPKDDVADFRFSDPDGLAQWPAPDRGVIRFSDSAHVERCRAQLHELCARWLVATGPAAAGRE